MNVVSNVGWFGRIGRSIKGISAGFLLALVSMGLLVFNERDAVRNIKANQELDKTVVSVANDQVEGRNEGRLVHLNGPSVTPDLVEHPQFGISENAIRLSWDSEIYQWTERKESKTKKNTGGSETTTTNYFYEKKWVSEAVDSSAFQERAGHENNSLQQFRSGQSQAKDVTVGAFNLPETLINKITSSEPYPLKAVPSSSSQEPRSSLA